jgi:Flp pilus assembly protein TadG
MSQSGRLESPTPSPAGRYGRRRRRHRTRGQSMVEFTLILPVLMLMIFGIYQFGQTYSDYIQVTNAARTGGRKALVSRGDANGVADAVTAAKGATWWLNTSQMTVTVSPSQPWTAGQTVTVTVTYPWSISLLGFVAGSGTLKSATTVRVE